MLPGCRNISSSAGCKFNRFLFNVFSQIFLSYFPVNTFIRFTNLEVSGCFQQHLHLIVCPNQMSIIRFNFLLWRHFYVFTSFFPTTVFFYNFGGAYCQWKYLFFTSFYFFNKMINKLMIEAANRVFLKRHGPKRRQIPEKISMKEFTFTIAAGLRPISRLKMNSATGNF